MSGIKHLQTVGEAKTQTLQFLRARQLGGIFAAPVNSTQIANRTKIKPRTLERALNELRNEGWVKWGATHGWELTQNGLSREEAKASTLLAVGWTPSVAPGRELFRGRVTADLGIVEPPFTDEEMQEITHAAKMECVRVLGRRKNKK